jgi:predicted HicB family RNase H-like nuclease
MARPTTNPENLTMVVRIPLSVKEKATRLAHADDRSLNNWIVSLIRKAVQESEEQSNG